MRTLTGIAGRASEKRWRRAGSDGRRWWRRWWGGDQWRKVGRKRTMTMTDTHMEHNRGRGKRSDEEVQEQE